MSAENITTLVVSVIALIASTVSVYINVIYSHKNIVSQERIKWLSDFREEIGNIGEAILLIKNTENNYEELVVNNIILKGENARCRLITRLKTTGVNNSHNKALKTDLEGLTFVLNNFDKIKNINFNCILKNANTVVEKNGVLLNRGDKLCQK